MVVNTRPDGSFGMRQGSMNHEHSVLDQACWKIEGLCIDRRFGRCAPVMMDSKMSRECDDSHDPG